MAYYRKKPHAIQAVRFLKNHIVLMEAFNETPPWLLGLFDKRFLFQEVGNGRSLMYEGPGSSELVTYLIPEGDWLIFDGTSLEHLDDKFFNETYVFVSLNKPEELEEEEDL